MPEKSQQIIVNSEKLCKFRRIILEWGRKNILDYPWRRTRDPYRILIAEMLLHRTRSEQVVPLYLEFVKRFPTVIELSQADYEEIVRILRSAGLSWRIRNIYEMAREVTARFGGKIPEEYDDLMSLPGVSDYIASAVRCFAFGYPEPLLDTNTVRIAGRVFGLRITDSSRKSKKFRKLMELLVDRDDPRMFNYSFVDFGKLVCRARNPLCHKCPAMNICEYHMKVSNEGFATQMTGVMK